MGLRRVGAGVGLVLMVAGCGGGEISLTEYVEDINATVNRASQRYSDLVTSPQGAVLVAEGAQLTDFTPQDLQVALGRVREIEAEVEEGVDAIEPPEQVADLHNLLFDFDDDFISSQEALAARAGTAAGWEELSESPEMAAYRAALAKDKQECAESQAELNTIAERREIFADEPWIPGELKEIFEAVLGCEGYPEHPEDVYRPSPTTTP
jgi:hypothetical protein